MQVLQSLIKSFICFFIYKALQRLFFVFLTIKVSFFIEKEVTALTIGVSS